MKLKLIAAMMLVLMMTVAYAQPGAGKGGGGERRGGGMRGMMGLDQEWAALCFEINMSPEQVAKLRPTFQWAWKARNSAMQSAMASHSFDTAGKTMASVNKTVDERIKIVLSSTQMAQWNKWKADQAALRQKMRAAAGGPGGGKAK
ncbi:MAG: hypothetical protein WCP21_13615 [Armatimonadota bacterium]